MIEFLSRALDFLNEVAESLGEHGPLVAQLAALAGIYVVFLVRAAYKANLEAIADGSKAHDDGAPKRSALSDRQNQLRLRGFARYQSNVQDLLNNMAIFVGDAHDTPSDRVDTDVGDGKAKPIPFWNLSAQSYLFAIGLATLYPLLLMLAVWSLTGQGGEIGAFVILPNDTTEPHWAAMTFEVLAVAIVIVLLWYSFPINKRDTLAHWVFAGFAVLTLFVLMAGPAWPWWVLVPAFLGALFAQGPLAAAMAWFVAMAVLAVAFFGARLEVVLVAMSFPIVAVLFYRAVNGFDGERLTRFVLLGAAFGLSAFAAAFFAQALESDPARQPFVNIGISLHGLVVLLCLLPLANALFDWISLSCTRALMQAVVAYRSRGFALDLIVAVALLAADIFIALMLSVLVTLTALYLVGWLFSVAPLAGTATAPDLVQALQADPLGRANIWIYAMLYSTLVPTFAHLIVGVYAIAQSIPLIDFDGLEKRLSTDWHHTDRRRAMARELTFLQVAEDVIAAFLFWLLVASLLYAFVEPMGEALVGFVRMSGFDPLVRVN